MFDSLKGGLTNGIIISFTLSNVAGKYEEVEAEGIASRVELFYQSAYPWPWASKSNIILLFNSHYSQPWLLPKSGMHLHHSYVLPCYMDNHIICQSLIWHLTLDPICCVTLFVKTFLPTAGKSKLHWAMENPSMSFTFNIYFLYYLFFYLLVMETLQVNKKCGFS